MTALVGEIVYGYIWMSFADPDMPKGQQFLGVVVTKGTDFIEAHTRVSAAGLNPGGECQGAPLESVIEWPEEYLDRLLTALECQKLEAINESRYETYKAEHGIGPGLN